MNLGGHMSESIQSLARATAIIEAIALHDNTMSITAIAQHVNLHKSTVHRILGTLIQLGYIRQNPTNSHYELTVKLFELGSSAIKHSDLVTLAHPYLESLRDLSGEVVHLVLPDQHDIIYVDKVESTQTLRMHSFIGRRSPMYCTAVGKAILATRSDEQLKIFWESITPEPRTPKTLTNFTDFQNEITRIRRVGFSYDNEEHEIGIRCIAFGIRNYAGDTIGAISISGPVQRMTDEHIATLIPTLETVKYELSRSLGYMEK